MITLNIDKSDAIILIKCLKVTKARKKNEARAHLKKGFIDDFEKKTKFIKAIDNLDHYLHYLTK